MNGVETLKAVAGIAATPEGRAAMIRTMADKTLGDFLKRPERLVGTEAAIAALRALSLIITDRTETGVRCSGVRVADACGAMAACFRTVLGSEHDFDLEDAIEMHVFAQLELVLVCDR
jgi:hypothetical protein